MTTMRATTKFLFVLTLAAATVMGLAQQALPNLSVDVDGRPVKLSPVLLELDTYLVPLRDAVSILSEGRASLNVVPGNGFDVVINGQVRVRIPTKPRFGQSVLVFGPDGPPTAVRSIPIESYPDEITPAGGSPTTFIDAELLCSALGVSVDVRGAEMSFLTSKYWCSQMGIDSSRVGDRLLYNLDNVPEFGVSPPARTILCWVRPAKPGFVQSYRLEGTKKDALLGENAFGDPREVLTPGDTAHARSVEAGKPLRFETYNYGDSLGQAVSFVSIVATKDVGGEDPVKAINSGALGPADWVIVGLRQHVSDMSVLFENQPVKKGEDIAAFAERNKNSASIVRVLNGLRQGEKLSEGGKLCVMVGLDDQRIQASQKSRYEFKGLYEVQHGDTLKSLAESWGVSPEDIVAANASIPGGGEPLPGDLLNVIAKKDGEPTKAASLPQTPQITDFLGSATTLVAVDVHETSRPESPIVGHIDKSKFVEVVGKVDNGSAYRIRYEAVMGFVPSSSIHLRDASPAPPVAPPIQAGPQSELVAREALKYLGTPYRWGGNSLTGGIDCSHFVAQVFRRVGWKEPSPPVTIQETIGDIVHCKPGEARRAGQNILLPDPARFRYATTDLRALRPGDRIIFQRGHNDASGSRHTGIFIGHVPAAWQARFGLIPYAFTHASSSRGVTVGSLVQRYYWGIYKFSVRSEPR